MDQTAKEKEKEIVH